jgi:hypothetical protein
VKHHRAIRNISLGFGLLVCATAALSSGNKYLRPTDFPATPANVQTELERQNCLIPQDIETKSPTNIVSGEFAKEGQRDWVAFCSVKGKSHLVVIWGGSAKCSGDPFGMDEPFSDDFLYEDWDGQWGTTRHHGEFWKLSVVPRAKVVARQRAGLAEPPLLQSASHDALQSTSVAGANVVYCTNGKWREIAYAD